MSVEELQSRIAELENLLQEKNVAQRYKIKNTIKVKFILLYLNKKLKKYIKIHSYLSRKELILRSSLADFHTFNI